MPLARITAASLAPGRIPLTGTVPVPDDWTPTPLHIRDSRGVAWPTTVETVMRGPKRNARILCLTAPVDSPGGKQRFTVEAGHVPVTAAHPVIPTVRIVSEDHRGTAYSAMIRPTVPPASEVKHTQRHGGELTAGTDRFLGFEAFITTFAGELDVVMLDLAVQNGRVDGEILHHLFFKSLRIEAPAGWTPIHGLARATSVGSDLIRANADGSMHGIQQGQAAEFRIALCRTGAQGRANALLDHTGFFTCDHSLTAWSWSNPKTAWFSPMAAPMPNLSLPNLNAYGANIGTIEGALATGSTLPSADMQKPCGPYFPRGSTDGGVTGGTGIQAFQGMDVLCDDKPSESLRVLMAMQAMDCDRMEGGCIVGADQRAVDCADWNLSNLRYVTHGKLNANHEGPWRRSQANQWRMQEVQAAGKLPAYWGQLQAFAPYDFAHLIRGTGPSMGLAYLCNDNLAKSRLANYAAWCRAYMLEYGWGAVASALQQGKSHPGKGGAGGRIHGWAGLTVLADLMLADDKKRNGATAWAKAAVDMLIACQLPTGGWQVAPPGDKPANTINAMLPVGTPQVCAAQAIEFGIFLNFVRALYVYTGDARILPLFAKAAKGCRDYHWQGGGPATTLAVRWADITKPAFVTRADAPAAGFTTATDTYQTWIVPLYALMANPQDPNGLWMLQALGAKSVADLTAKMPSKMMEGAGAVLGWMQAQAGPVVVDPPVTPPPVVPPPRTPADDTLDRIRAAMGSTDLRLRDRARLAWAVLMGGR